MESYEQAAWLLDKLNNALRCFPPMPSTITESEVSLRFETIVNLLKILRYDVWAMKKEWKDFMNDDS